MFESIVKLKNIKANLSRRVSQALFDDDLGKPIASGVLHKINSLLGLHSLADWLPYQFYDPETEIFHTMGGKGMVLEAVPMVGASEDNAEALYNFFQRVLPEGTIVQFMLYASPFLGKDLNAYLDERKGHNPLLEKTAEYRVDYFKKGIFKTLISGQQAVLRDYRLLVSVVFDNKMFLSDTEILSYRNRLSGTLKGMGIPSKVLGPEQFLQWVDSLIRPSDAILPKEFIWKETESLSSQLAAPEQTHRLTSQRILVNENDWEIRNYRVADFPKDPVSLCEMDDLIGSLFDNNSRIGCPFSLSLIVKICNQQEERRTAQIRAPRARQRAAMVGRVSPKAVEEATEARTIIKHMEDFERVVLGEFQATLYYKPGTGDEHEVALTNVFQASTKKWRLVKNNMLQMVTLLAHLPLAQSHAFFDELKNLGLTHKLWAKNVANLAPILSEMKGMDSHRLMIVGRRGQALFWDPFGNQRGNYNTCVAGISGSGKSVTVQEIAASLIATGARVWIIDVGRSYKKLCHLLGGQFIEFTRDTKICLNPFSTVNTDEVEEFYAFLTPLVALMVDPNQQISAFELSLIEQAVKAVWNNKKHQGGIGDIAVWLSEHSDNRARDIGTTLYSYSPEGQYGGYFNGEANVDFDSPMVVFELEEINSNKRLQGILFMLLMYHVTEKMYLGGRTKQMALIIDEAWDMLKGGHGGSIIESIARRARKYKGCLITITQSISDFFASPAGQAAYNNSYWRILHAQNKSNISNLIGNKQISLDPFQERLLRSISTEHGQYSEMMIQGDSGEYAVGRLLLDPYSRILYSTQAQEFAEVNALCEQGFSLADAIGKVAERVFGK